MLDAKSAEEKSAKKGGSDIIISEYMSKRDDLEYRTLQELNEQMTNWVENVQTQNYAAGASRLDPLDQQLYDEYGLSETDSDSDFLDEKLQQLKAKVKQKKLARRQQRSLEQQSLN